MIGIQTIEPGFEKTLLPADDGRRTGLQPPFDGVEGSSFGQHQDQLGAKDVTRWQGARLSNAVQFQTLIAGKGDFTAGRRTSLEA